MVEKGGNSIVNIDKTKKYDIILPLKSKAVEKAK